MKVSRFGSINATITTLAQPLEARNFPSLTADSQLHAIHAIGGKSLESGAAIATVDTFWIKDNVWRRKLPELNSPRWCHSSCTLGSHLYVFQGRN